MVTFDDMAAHDNHWKAFGGDPEWKKISAIPDYADAKLVSHITSTMLAPVACSQIQGVKGSIHYQNSNLIVSPSTKRPLETVIAIF